MSFKQEYQQKLCTAQEAVQVVRSGDWIDFGWCASAPETLDAALAERYEELYDVKARGGPCSHEDHRLDFAWNTADAANFCNLLSARTFKPVCLASNEHRMDLV
jgi:acyl-CoA hydrolase